jgi:hypothetical protein
MDVGCLCFLGTRWGCVDEKVREKERERERERE